jgi:uroporphyrinogen decarboxylase
MPEACPRDRVSKAIRFEQTDRTPRDFAAVPEIWEQLSRHFGTEDRSEILDHLDIDCRIVSYDSFCSKPGVGAGSVDMDASRERSSIGGMYRIVEADGSNRDIWGAHRRRVRHQFGYYDHFPSFPLAEAATTDDLRRYDWPTPAWWDFGGLRDYIGRLIEKKAYSIRYRMGSVFETSWSLRGFEQFQLDLASQSDVPVYILERIAEVHLANLQTVLETAGDLIDIVYFYDDVATQQGLLISPKMYEKYVQPHHQAIIDLAARFHRPVMMHCCGSVYPLIERLIQMGLKILNPIQPKAKDMEPEKLAAEFGGRIAFHGGIDIQEFLPKATPDQVRDKVAHTCSVLGAQGGYILAPAHHFQADTPLENVLAMYSLQE